ncbi:hypothetical protein GEMRC1_005798 [Eukaryota sp. GEM-RC1]
MGITLYVSGVSCSGKTTLAHRLLNYFQEYYPTNTHSLIHQDDFYRTDICNDIPIYFWETIDSIDVTKLSSNIEQAAAISDIVIVEGFLLFHPLLLQLSTHLIYLDIDFATAQIRRNNRSIGDDCFIDPPGFFETTVWTQFFKSEYNVYTLENPPRNWIKVNGNDNSGHQLLSLISQLSLSDIFQTLSL